MNSLCLALALLAAPVFQSPGPERAHDRILVANRGSGTLSVIDARSDVVVATLPLPAGLNAPEPMYVTVAGQRWLVGDRANDRIVAIDSRCMQVVATTPVGRGIWHMFCDPEERMLWVASDIDRTLSVVDTRRMATIATVPIPADLVQQGARPHDIVVGHRFAYASLVGVAGANDFVIQLDTRTLATTRRAAVGKDPHLALGRDLFVPAQGASTVHVLDPLTLAPITTIAVPGAHGAWLDGRTFYSTDLPGGGPRGLVTIDAKRHQVIGFTDTPFPAPHNVVTTRNGKKIYVTHSTATSDKVSVYRVASSGHALPVHVASVAVGRNPFGIALAETR